MVTRTNSEHRGDPTYRLSFPSLHFAVATTCSLYQVLSSSSILYNEPSEASSIPELHSSLLLFLPSRHYFVSPVGFILTSNPFFPILPNNSVLILKALQLILYPSQDDTCIRITRRECLTVCQSFHCATSGLKANCQKPPRHQQVRGFHYQLRWLQLEDPSSYHCPNFGLLCENVPWRI